MSNNFFRLILMVMIVVMWTTSCTTSAASDNPVPTLSTPSLAQASSSSSIAQSIAVPDPATTLGSGKKIGKYSVWLMSSPNPPVRGSNTLQAIIVDTDGRAINDTQVSFDLDMTTMSHGRNVIRATSQGNGRYAGGVFFMMPGPWRVIVSLQRAGESAVSDRFVFNVNAK